MWFFVLRSLERLVKWIGDCWFGEDGGEVLFMYIFFYFYYMSVDGWCW